MFSDLNLNNRLIRSLDDQNIKTPTPVQLQAIPQAHQSKDLMVSAATGTGKTLAFLLPIMNQLLDKKGAKEGSRCLVLAPTRELAKQIFKTCQGLSRYTHLKCALFVGGEDYKFQKALLRKDPEIVIATPGRILEHVEKGNALFSHLEYLVLDEADRMLEMGFYDDVMAIAESCSAERQTLLFSATLDRRGITELAKGVLNNPETIKVDSHRQQHENITQQIVLADDYDNKKNLLNGLLSTQEFTKALVFTNTKIDSNRVRGFLRGKKYRASSINSDMTQEERTTTMRSFSTGSTQILVATDVASRGLDINDIDLVINFDMARNGDDYIHRIGRTGRVNNKGLAVSFICPNEWNLMIAIERYINSKIEKRVISGLLGKWKGPKKTKTSGKLSSKVKRNKIDATGTKKSKTKSKSKAKAKTSKPKIAPLDGFAPIKKKK
jgi:superfamily II DNA/RNA helicase